MSNGSTSRKIVGITVGTPYNPQRVGEQLENGKSAYELALEHGFKGTEEEWLESLHGNDGADGKDGAPGKDGVDGRDGLDGQVGKDGNDGKSAYQYAVDGGYTGTEEEFAVKMATEIPDKEGLVLQVIGSIGTTIENGVAVLGKKEVFE